MSDQEQTPEAYNAEQDDAPAQAQTLADEALGRSSAFEFGDSEKPEGGVGELDGAAPDLVDTMNQMVTSGHIDMDAFAGERSDDDEEAAYGVDAIEPDDMPRGAE